MNGHRLQTSKIKPACGGRSACQRPLEAGVCDRVGAGAQEWLGRPWFAYVRENHAGVYAFASMVDTCVSLTVNFFWPDLRAVTLGAQPALSTTPA
jgi:hypothetical protein